MNATYIPKLGALLAKYFTHEEVLELAQEFEVAIPAPTAGPTDSATHGWQRIAAQLVRGAEQANTRGLLRSIVEQADIRNVDGIARTDWERRQAHEALIPFVVDLRKALADDGGMDEIATAAATPFAAKSALRELLAQATSPILVVDPYVGVGTLDCFRGIVLPIRLLTADTAQAIEPGFDRALAAFRKEGRAIEVRQGSLLHDRHLGFNQRCWLVGSSLKDAGKKAFHCAELIDVAAAVLADLESRWQAARPYP